VRKSAVLKTKMKLINGYCRLAKNAPQREPQAGYEAARRAARVGRRVARQRATNCSTTNLLNGVD